MKFIITIAIAGILILGMGIIPAQELKADWFSIDGGAGASTGGIYALNSAIGQADLGAVGGGIYAFQDGFWIALVPQSETTAVLYISRASGGSLTISWTGSPSDFVLQESPILGPSAIWADVGAPVIVNGGENTVIQPAASGDRFYRLRHP